MKCGKCEKNIPDGSKFCMYCGSGVQAELACHYCGFSGIPLGASFCPVCGAQLRKEADVAWDTLKIGDYYYNDGTFSTQLDESKICVGVVFSLETTEIEKAHGWTHGQIVALEDAGDKKYKWGRGPAGDLPAHVYEEESVALQDRNGYLYTHSGYTDGDNFEAFNMARCYPVLLPTCTSGWYLPSLGQWRDILTNLGKVTVTDEGYFDNIEAWKNLDFLNIGVGFYWSSTAGGGSSSWGVYFLSGNVSTTNRQGAYRVRPVAAI